MGYLTRYGALEAIVPSYGGRTFFVAPSDEYRVQGKTYRSSDNYPGGSPMRALRTINRAWALCTANVGDQIVLLPGTHTLTTSVAASVAGVTMTGIGEDVRTNFMYPQAIVTGPSGDQAINVTAANVEISRLRFVCITAISCIDFSVAADRFYIHDCSFDMSTAAASTSTIAIDSLGAASSVVIDHCYFDEVGAQGPAIDMTATLDSQIRNCTIVSTSGTWAAAISTGAGTDRLLITDCDVQVCGTALTAGVDGTGADTANGVQAHRCVFGAKTTVSLDNYDAGEAQIANVYKAGVGAADGGTLVVAIT